ncbi:hypothetical protein L3Q82_003203 [Scortum barcoo]|uniref:Uncharacterized protein n=1 Tax=Scortum barcoo TaxID=214431 RepID=A0ACB8VRR3_9TELE|nr:hypothetical protein L3Q82_003203 [Scortum barcoo]
MVTTCARITAILCSGSSAFYSAAYCPRSARRRLTLREVGDLSRPDYVRLRDTLNMEEDRLLLTVVRHGLSACRRDLRRKVVSRRVRDQRKALKLVENLFSVVLPAYSDPPNPSASPDPSGLPGPSGPQA